MRQNLRERRRSSFVVLISFFTHLPVSRISSLSSRNYCWASGKLSGPIAPIPTLLIEALCQITSGRSSGLSRSVSNGGHLILSRGVPPIFWHAADLLPGVTPTPMQPRRSLGHLLTLFGLSAPS
ncbi:hypothetical protein B0H63DRAFT_489616 [Podospora didyma]|uniref:Uncharacterized protein n=1 Tax=Podospora didyma TaxID=330526 RepID=A0AAE0K0C1_9PEZI|nr:hypothetical protein B0H63DRAFT_489616 [Podospora didyma]